MASVPIATVNVPPIATEGVTNNPVATQEVDGSSYPMTFDRHGGLQVSPIHSQGYVQAARNNLFRISGAGATGVEILAPGGTTSGFCFGSLAGSGINMEVRRLRVVPIGATVVVAALALEYGVCPVSTTYVTGVVASPVGNGAQPACKAWNAVTIVANAYLQALPLFFPATTIVDDAGYEFIFDGELLIAPGFAVNLVSTITQGTIKFLCDIQWSEHLI